jgi:hypothetical protein
LVHDFRDPGTWNTQFLSQLSLFLTIQGKTMTPQERELIMKVAERIQNAPQQTKDPEADRLIAEQMARRPDANYLLTQAVIVQEYGLQQAQERIHSLEQELTQARSAPTTGNAAGGSFLGGMFGGPSTPPSPAAVQSQAQRPPMSAGKKPPTGAPGRPTANQPNQPNNAQQAGGNRSGMGDFMRNAAMMAVGVAGGQMLFSGLQGMFGDSAAETAVADMPPSEDATAAADSPDPAAEDSGGWGGDQGVSEEGLAGDSSAWEQPDPAADPADPWGAGGAGAGDETLSDSGFDDGGFDDGGDSGGDDFGGDDDWG